MAETGAIANIGDLAKPATLLIEKISDALGGAFRPFQIKRIAKAEADAAIVRANAEIEVTELQKRAMHRFFEEEAKKQENIESIASKAFPQLDGHAKPEQMEDDWVTNFFDKCRIVSDGEMQQLWGKVLAGEANAPGSYSKRTVNFVASLDKQDAELFSRLCRFAWQIAGRADPLIFDVENKVYSGAGLQFHNLTHLATIGLITFASQSGFQRVGVPKTLPLYYYGSRFTIEFPKEADNSLETGHVVFTQAGQELAPICGSQSEPGFCEHVLSRLSTIGLIISSPYPDDRRASGPTTQREER